MRGLDYRWLEALDAVIALGSFERAAEALFVTQSAVSQRVKQLEKFIAQPVLIREQPPRTTEIGDKLLGLYQKVRLLEHELVPELIPEAESKPLIMTLATNADSLATWLLPALKPILTEKKVMLNLLVEDESRTLTKLRSGEVVGAISMESLPVVGCQAEPLGRVDFVCVASPDFVARHFADGINKTSLKMAPSVVFDHNDAINADFLYQHFGLTINEVMTHTLRSSDAFVTIAKLGMAYCIVPAIQIESELASGELVNILPTYRYHRQLYWHHWTLESGILAEVSRSLVDYARQILPQKE
jgi:LysR family transcriptional regulator (chromosome initiation inhibitor)